jgi:hypothetical protein
MGKWTRKVRYTDTFITKYKAYIYKGMAFRLHYPKTYNAAAPNDGKKYPLMVFYHGAGEAAPISDNEFQLLHGRDVFSKGVSDGIFDGYILAPQSTSYFYPPEFEKVKEIIEYMIINNKVDPFHLVINGLSQGGQSCWQTLDLYPTFFSAISPMSWTQSSYAEPAFVNKLKYTSIWHFQGLDDTNPFPFVTNSVKDAFLGAGGQFKNTNYPGIAHGTWWTAWGEADFWPYHKRAYSSNPWRLYNKILWPGTPINETLGVVAGFEAYEWRKNSALIAGATSNTLVVNSTDTFRLRVKRNGVWSDWSRIPMKIYPGRYQAENFVAKSHPTNSAFPRAEVTTDQNGDYHSTGGLNVGWLDAGAWMDYTITPAAGGTYPLRFRYASTSASAQLRVKNSNGVVLATVNLPNTGGWQTWQTVSTSVVIPGGTQTLRIESVASGWNLNWFEFGESSGGPLPVNFVSIDVKKEGTNAKLTWKVSDEVNVQRYVVEKSLDGRTFNEIGSVNATGAIQYSFTDLQVQAKNFYRVKSVDIDGSFKYSSVVSLNGSKSSIVLQAYPMPTRNSITLQHGTAKQGSLITIVSMEGKVVKTQLPNRNGQQTTIDLQNALPGVYMIRFDDGNGTVETLRIVKQ